MRVLMLVTDAHGGFGGIAQYNKDVLAALSASKHISEVVVVPRVLHERNFSAPENVIYDLDAANGSFAYVASTFRQAMRRKPFDLIYCAHINLMPLAALLGKAQSVPILLAIYGIDVWKSPGWMTGRFASSAADFVLSISKVTLDRFLNWSDGHFSKTAIVPNAIQMSEYGLGEKNPELVERYNITGRQTIMTLGRMPDKERCKGFDEVIDCLPTLIERNSNIIYLAVGDGQDRPRLEAKAAQLGLGKSVIFTGRIDENEKADHYRLADAYVMPSSGEGFGFVILEALACGLPVVGSETDGTFEALRGGKLGKAINPADKASLVDAIETALATPKRVQEGLRYFAFDRFQVRIERAVIEAAGSKKN